MTHTTSGGFSARFAARCLTRKTFGKITNENAEGKPNRRVGTSGLSKSLRQWRVDFASMGPVLDILLVCGPNPLTSR
jgi:hypothetical protein